MSQQVTPSEALLARAGIELQSILASHIGDAGRAHDIVVELEYFVRAIVRDEAQKLIAYQRR